MHHYQQLDAEIAQYKAEQDLIKQRLDALKQQRSDVIKQAQDAALPGIMAQLRALGITQSQLLAYFGRAALGKSVIHKYWNPETEETHSGKGTLPGWLVGKTGKGRTGDSRYLNPAWVANEDAKDAAKKEAKEAKQAARKSKTKSSGASVADQALSSNVAVTVPNDAPAIVDGAERPVPNDGAPIDVANVAVVDMAHVATKIASAPIV